jgi:hypothetical protein
MTITSTAVRVLLTLLAATFAHAATAQTLSSRMPATAETKYFIGGEGGAQAVNSAGGLVGGLVGLHLSPRTDLFGEAIYLQDVATRRRVELASNVAGYLTQTQGKAATGTVSIPAMVISGGVRHFLSSSPNVRPYVIAQAGLSRTALRPSFVLGGADVTTSLGQYGITLGADLAGTAVKPAFGAGVGFMVAKGVWYIDPSVRLLSVEFSGQRAAVVTAAVGIGRRF